MVLEIRPHWSFLGWDPLLVLATVGALVAVIVVWPSAPVAVGWVLLALVVLSSLWLAGGVLRWRRTVLVVTTTRLVQRSGVLARRGVEVRLEKVNEISYQQSIFQRLLGTGWLYLDVGGDRGVLPFSHVPRPAKVASVLHDYVDGRHRDQAPPGRVARIPADTPPTGMAFSPPAGMPPGDNRPSSDSQSVTLQLLELDELRRRGILSEEEFAERKTRLLDRL